LGFEKIYPNNVKVVSYEDLVEQASRVTKDMFEFVSLSFSEETRKFLLLSQTTHSDHGNSVFKNKEVKDTWKKKLDPEIASEIKQDLIGTVLEKYLYK